MSKQTWGVTDAEGFRKIYQLFEKDGMHKHLLAVARVMPDGMIAVPMPRSFVEQMQQVRARDGMPEVPVTEPDAAFQEMMNGNFDAEPAGSH